MVDWSGGNDTGARPRKDAIWICVARETEVEEPIYFRNRPLAEDWLAGLIGKALSNGQRLLVGADFPFGYPKGFAAKVTGSDDPIKLWDWFAAHLKDAPEGNNRFALAAQLNRRFPGVGPFWFNGTGRDIPDLPRKGLDRQGHGMPERRNAEEQQKGAFPVWQMGGAGAVGGQVMTGLATFARLRARFPEAISVWPFQALDRPVALVEVWPSLLAGLVAERMTPGRIKDAEQVRLMAGALARLDSAKLAQLLDVSAPEEGWILGIGHKAALEDAARLQPPAPRFGGSSMPAGVDWLPVDDAFAQLRSSVDCAVGVDLVSVHDAAGRVLAKDVAAQRSNPPAANSAVDGYGFAAQSVAQGSVELPLLADRARAGHQFSERVPHGHAVRILTGAPLPDGVDTVVLDENSVTDGACVAFHNSLRQGANTRPAGEDICSGDVALAKGRQLAAADLAVLAAVGLGRVSVRAKLRVGILSTGDEIVPVGAPGAGAHQIFDANRPMLLAAARRMGFLAHDLGHVSDSPEALADRMNDFATQVDAIITTGGASGGDEDHVSALLRDRGTLSVWRVAVKPGRPFAMGAWAGTEVFALPGNPVAAMVCMLVFARPALSVMAGGPWVQPVGYDLPAAFEKKKQSGRREFLRARVDSEGAVEVFSSEGSGKISGLSWADGLVELPDEAVHVRPGDRVRYLPYAAFGL
ncbi:MAG: gephyrin-like molybdotransferase Glp [Pseudomonadota bacterium]